MRAGNLRHRSVGVVVRRRGDGAVLAHRRAGVEGRVAGSLGPRLRRGVRRRRGARSTPPSGSSPRRPASTSTRPSSAASARRTYADDDVAAVGTLFEIDHDGPFAFADGEVEATEWVPLRTASAAWLDAHPHCPDTVHLLRTIGVRWPDER